jgi:hypothetical protein
MSASLTTSVTPSSYEEFIADFVAGVNEKLAKVEKNLYELGEFILNKCEEGKRFGKKKEDVFNDLCSHPNFRYSKKTFYNYAQTAEFIRKLPEPSIPVDGKVPFTIVQEIAQAKLPQEEKIRLVGELAENPMREKVLRQKIQAKRLEIYSQSEDKNWLIPFDIWQFPTCDPRFGQAAYPGRIPGQIILNLIHYYMEGDVFLSVYPGSHTDRDVCRYLGKLCVELNQNVREPWNIEDNSIDFVFHDPPYWHAKAQVYKEANDLSHLSLVDFYKAIDFTAKESYRVLKTGKVVAIIIGNERNPYEDLAFKVYQIFREYFLPIDRIIVPYAGNSEMHTAWAIARAKEKKIMLNGFRDLTVFRKI